VAPPVSHCGYSSTISPGACTGTVSRTAKILYDVSVASTLRWRTPANATSRGGAIGDGVGSAESAGPDGAGCGPTPTCASACPQTQTRIAAQVPITEALRIAA
jgi:hypothetical protein